MKNSLRARGLKLDVTQNEVDLRLIAGAMNGGCALSLTSPSTGESELFHWTPCKDGEIREDNSEIIDVINWIANDIDELVKDHEFMDLLKNVDRSSLESVSNLSTHFNKRVLHLLKEDGEIREDNSEIIDVINWIANDIDELVKDHEFMDLLKNVDRSSLESVSNLSVGQVVLQVAACSDAKYCYGIEKADYPSACAKELDGQFRHWMTFYGKPYRPYMLERGDFLAPDYQEKIATSGVLFANNFAFGPEVDHQLKQRFANLKEGARVISSKAFCPLNFRITDRNLGDIGSIMRVSCLTPIQNAVSWTDKPFSYYVHTIDRSILERYFLRLKNPALKDDTDVVRRDRKGRIISEQSIKEVVSNATASNLVNQSSDLEDKPRLLRNGHSLSLTDSSRQRRAKSLGCPSTTRTENYARQLRVKARTNNKNNTNKNNAHRKSLNRRRIRQAHSVSSNLTKVNSESHSKETVVVAVSAAAAAVVSKRDRINGRRLMNDTLSILTDSQDPIGRSFSYPVLPRGSARGSGTNTPAGSTPISCAAGSSEDGQTTGELNRDVAQRRDVTMRGSSSSDEGDYVVGVDRRRNVYHPLAGVESDTDSTTAVSCTTIATQSPDGTIVSQKSSLGNGRAAAAACNSPAEQARYLGKSEFNDTQDAATPSNGVSNSTTEDEDTSVARRRAVRKCRQLPLTVAASTSTTAPLIETSPSPPPPPVRPRRVRIRPIRPHAAGTSTSRVVAATARRKLKLVGRPVTITSRELKQSTVVELPDPQTKLELSLLHCETVVQTSEKPSVIDSSGVRCNDPMMTSFTCHYQPVEMHSLEEAKRHATRTANDPNTGHLEDAVPLALTQYLELSKRMFMQHFQTLRTPDYAANVRNLLAAERERHRKLTEHTRTTEEAITRLHADGTELLRRFTRRLGILISTPSAFFAQARKLIKHHHALETKISDYRKHISELSAANQNLVRRHQIEANRLLASALPVSAASSSQTPVWCPKTTPKPQSIHHAPDLRNHGWNALLPPSSDSSSNSIPPPPPLTLSCTALPSSGPVGMQSSCRHKTVATRRGRRSIAPLLLPQSDTAPVTRSLVSDDSSPPVLHRPHERPSLPPPPPLLPMHRPPPPPIAVSSPMSSLTSSVNQWSTHTSPSSSTIPATTSQSNPPLSIGSAPVFHPCKSMHASLQDLITDEFSRSPYAASLNHPASGGNRLQTTHSGCHESTATTSSSSPTHTIRLPPRKRAWDSSCMDSSSTEPKSARVQSPPSSSNPPSLSPVELHAPSCDLGVLIRGTTVASTSLAPLATSSHLLPITPYTRTDSMSMLSSSPSAVEHSTEVHCPPLAPTSSNPSSTGFQSTAMPFAVAQALGP